MGLRFLITFCFTYLLWDLSCKLIKRLNRWKNECALNQYVRNETRKIYFDLSEKDLEDAFNILSFEKDPLNKYDRILRDKRKSIDLSKFVVKKIPFCREYNLIQLEEQQNSYRFIFDAYFYKLLNSGGKK